MSYDPTGPYPPEQNSPWQPVGQPPYGAPAPGTGYPQPGYSTSGAPGHPSSGAPGYPASGYPASGPPGYPGYPQPQPPRKSHTGLIIALIVVILVVGCGGSIAVLAIVGSKSTSSGSASATSTHDRQGPASTGNGGIAGSGTVAFGPDHTVKWNDKIEASVLSVQRFTPSKTAAGTHAGQVGIKVTVKITNNSTRQFDLTLAGVNVKSGANGTQADTIFDSANNLGLGFEGSVAPGHSATASYGFSVPEGDLSKLDVEVSPGFDYDAGIFEGPVG